MMADANVTIAVKWEVIYALSIGVGPWPFLKVKGPASLSDIGLICLETNKYIIVSISDWLWHL